MCDCLCPPKPFIVGQSEESEEEGDESEEELAEDAEEVTVRSDWWFRLVDLIGGLDWLI